MQTSWTQRGNVSSWSLRLFFPNRTANLEGQRGFPDAGREREMSLWCQMSQNPPPAIKADGSIIRPFLPPSTQTFICLFRRWQLQTAARLSEKQLRGGCKGHMSVKRRCTGRVKGYMSKCARTLNFADVFETTDVCQFDVSSPQPHELGLLSLMVKLDTRQCRQSSVAKLTLADPHLTWAD